MPNKPLIRLLIGCWQWNVEIPKFAMAHNRRWVTSGRDISRGMKSQQKSGWDRSGSGGDGLNPPHPPTPIPTGWVGIGHLDLNFFEKSWVIMTFPDLSQFIPTYPN